MSDSPAHDKNLPGQNAPNQDATVRACPECGLLTNESTCPHDGEMTLVRQRKVSTDDRIGQVIGGRYKIEKVIGQGGFGAVYRAKHTATGDTIAIKVLRTAVEGQEDVVARFRHEAKTTSRLKHPNTVRVFDFGQMDDGNLFIAMEFLDGQTLTHLQAREGPLEPKRLARIAIQVLKALAEAHSKGLVHRDLKPDNIFLQTVHGEADFVKVLDFGIAKSLTGDQTADLTASGAIVGTPRYMSPEQASGMEVDARTDLYALGLILYEGLTGQTPFVADSPLSMLLRRVAEEPPRVEQSLRLPTPRGVCEVVRRAMARRPQERFSSAEEMAAALQAELDTPTQPAQSVVRIDTGADGDETMQSTLPGLGLAPDLVMPATRVELLTDTDENAATAGMDAVGVGAVIRPQPIAHDLQQQEQVHGKSLPWLPLAVLVFVLATATVWWATRPVPGTPPPLPPPAAIVAPEPKAVPQPVISAPQPVNPAQPAVPVPQPAPPQPAPPPTPVAIPPALAPVLPPEPAHAAHPHPRAHPDHPHAEKTPDKPGAPKPNQNLID